MSATRQDITRREFIGLLVAAGVLAACDDDGQPAATSESRVRSRTVGSGWASTTIDGPPTRIVATADRDQLDVLLAMGIAPVLYGRSGDYEGTPPWIDASQLAAVPAARMPGAFEPNLERIAAARPDLIVDAWADQRTHDLLSAIAPTVQIKRENTDSWRDAQRLAGRATWHDDDAEDAVARTEAVIGEQAARLRTNGAFTLALAYIEGGEFVMLPGNEIGGRLFRELGADVLTPPSGASERFSLERLEEMLGAADVIVTVDAGGIADQEANPLFRRLAAPRTGHYAVLSTDLGSACYQESSLSLRYAAEPVTDLLLDAVNGQGRRLE
jgi:ABC-type Fe3+-hydroxamate transport system substrate-binding protein